MYDASTTRWSEQMVLGLDSNNAATDGPVPMEIDRVEGKGKGKGPGKGKSKDKGSHKGKSGGKQKGKDGKGKNKGDRKGSKGGGAERFKGKGKGDAKQCYVCGQTGHFARDCWQNVRNVAADGHGTTAQGSPASSTSGWTSVSQHQSGAQSSTQSSPPQQNTQNRVARICETGDDAKHGDLVFDLRCPSPTSVHGSVNVVHHFIGDSEDCMMNGFVRAVVDEMDDSGEELYNILIDSGADASIFPMSLIGRGLDAEGVVGRLQDAQGSEIPVEAVKDMEVRLKDITGKTICLRERVAVSSRVHQPILSFGRLMENGWTIDGRAQALTHSLGAHIPVELQNKSLVVQGTVRVMRELAGTSDTLHIRAIQADVMNHVLVGEVGWKLDEFGRGIGRH